MALQPPAALATAINREYWRTLEDKSAHSDIASALTASVNPLGDVQIFCPDPHAYRYLAASTKGIIFGFAISMDSLVFRLDEKMRGRALRTGSLAYPECGEEWIAVLHHEQDSDWPAVDTVFWARQAYVYARESAARGTNRGA